MANSKEEEGEGADLQDHWYLVDTHGQKFRLPKTMLFLGSDECDVIVASQSVDKRHAILAFDIYLNRFKVKDLSTRNGTFVNNSRIPEQEYVALNHMDSIRLGQDAMMYHMEQASQITSHGGILPDPHFIPSWANRTQDTTTTIHVHAHDLAECQGCIAEQNIEHSCSFKLNKSNDSDIHVEDLHHSHRHPRHTCEDHLKEHLQHTGSVPSPAQDFRGEHSRHEDQPCQQAAPQRQDHATDLSEGQSFPRGDQTTTVHAAASDVRPHGRNACPTQRQLRQVAPVSALFTTDAQERQDNTSSPDNAAANVQNMFIVPFDDSICNTNNSASITTQGRRPHNSRNPNSPDLTTVQKGTPLYGQPAWWGDELVSSQGETATAIPPKHNGDDKSASKNSPPVSRGLSRGEMDSSPGPATALPKTGSMAGDSTKPLKGPTYMEIPLRDDDSTNGVEKSKGSMTATKSRRSSLTNDSLSMSPDLKQPSKTAQTQSPSAEVNPAMSFTIDLDDPEHPPKKSLNIGSSISEFVPSKIRKNFQERKSVSSKVSSKESTPSKNSDEREVSPLAQSKIDEIWSTVVEAKGKSRLSSIQAEAGTSLRSPNLNEISQFSQPSQERRKSLEKDADKRGSMKRSASTKSPQTSQSSKLDVSSSHKFASESPTVGVPKLDSASYLIDKMFEGDSSFSGQTSKEHSPELPAPKEVTDHSKVNHPSTERTTFIRPVINSTTSLDSATQNILGKSFPKLSLNCSADDADDDLQITEDVSSDNEPREKDDREDKISEAGTYTIEADVMEGHEEEEEARRMIDEVFGVDVDNEPLPIIGPLILNELKDYNVHDLGDDSENTLLDDSQSPGEDDTDLITDEFDDETNDMTDTNGLQNWVSQLTSLTNQKSAVSNKSTKEESEVSVTKKPPQGINRKRPGTGRKLPSIPSDKSPVNIESSLPVGHQNLKTGEDVLARKSVGYDINGRHIAGSSNKYGISSSQAHHSALRTGLLASQSISVYSHGSLEAEVSFQGAATVVGAVQNRMSYKPSHDKNNSHDSDVDTSSIVALVNGIDGHVRPVLYKSPRDALAKKQVKESPPKPVKTSSTPPAVLGKKLAGKSVSQTVPVQRNVTTPRSTPASTPTSGTKKSSSSDVFSRKDSLDNGSTISDVSSETGDANLSRSSSKGKGAITMTRTNKTFDLRRARADSLDEPPTLRSTKSSSKSGASGSVGRPHSLYSNPRNKSSEATNFGAQVIQKMQSHITQEKIHKISSVSSKTDSGKHILNQGLQRASSLTISHPIPSSKRESTPKSYLRAAAPLARSSLAITGISSISRGSQSQPGSRSGSPKSAEKMAWKRRKEYDARKSVADAKATKTKECSTSGVTMRPKPSTSANINRAMTRSASFTNTAAGLSFGHSSVSISQDFSDRGSLHHQRKNLQAFLPLHTSHQNGRSTHSADEDDSIASANSTQDSARIVASLLEIPSAFTPPLPRNKAVSPDNSTPCEASLSLRRRLLNMDGGSSPSLSKSLHASGNERDLGHSSTGSSPQTSYDSLIVTSVYQLSQKLKTTTDRILSKLKDHGKTTQTPSPVDDFLNDSGKSEIMAWKTANQELASTLKNLRMLERHMQKINVTLFPDVEVSSDGSSHVPAKQHIKQKLLEDIERKFGFQPIDQPASPEMEELSGQFHN